MRSAWPGPEAEPTEVWVGGWRLLAVVGEGGMGVVHLAEDSAGRRVALKVLRPHIIGDEESRRRLAGEVTALRRVRSPRVAEVIDADPWGPTPYVATRHVPGPTLHRHVAETGPLAEDHVRLLAAGLAEALLSVHDAGVLHRDVKPTNVILHDGAPVLIDFGLARLAEDPRLTATGYLVGTPGYLAPEILQGDPATTASDVHALAATVVLAATGTPPFGGGPPAAVMDRVRRGEHDLASVPATLEPLLRACLATQPSARPTLPELAVALGSGGPPVRLRAPAAAPEPTRRLPVGTASDAGWAPDEGNEEDDDLEEGEEQDYDAEEEDPPRRRRSALAQRLQAVLLLVTTLLLVAVSVAAAPFVAASLVALLVLAVRTGSLAAESFQVKRWQRGRPRWFDRPVAVLGTPWYLLVATGGTLLLLLWAGLWAALAMSALLLAGQPTEQVLLGGGAALGLTLWWGPGARRVRRPLRGLARRSARSAPIGWLAWLALVLAVGMLTWGVADRGVAWDPLTEPPWAPGTRLGDLVERTDLLPQR